MRLWMVLLLDIWRRQILLFIIIYYGNRLAWSPNCHSTVRAKPAEGDTEHNLRGAKLA